MLYNIPEELQKLEQWVCASDNKIPIDPKTGEKASPTDRETWGTFKEACDRKLKHVGFVLTETDPYTIIDLDNKPENPATADHLERFSKIIEFAKSYTELSAGGQGYHIIVRGEVPKGVRRDGVEVYSSGRYMICTGKRFNNELINTNQELLDLLYNEMNSVKHVSSLVDYDETLTDEQIVETAQNAVNGEKFLKLCKGEFESYPSQSEADFALLSILTFYSRSNNQVKRLFRYSKLGKREKAARDGYLDTCLAKIRANQPSIIDISKLKTTTSDEDANIAREEKKIEYPPGLAGEVAQYIFGSAIRPVREIALGASLALLAGIIGRSYNISGTGLNQYIVLLAKTGSGKEGAASGIDLLMADVRKKVPASDQFIGPGAFASGQALVRVLDEKPCFVSVLGEIGLTLQQLCEPNANSANVMLKKVLLDLYSKSGNDKILRSSVYSDTERNTQIIKAPSVTLLGESTPESFYRGLDYLHIAEGLIPRFMILEYTGRRPIRNSFAFIKPGSELVAKLADLCSIAVATEQNNTFKNVAIDENALDLFDTFDKLADKKINEGAMEVEMQLWNRAHLKALKLGALVSVGCNPHEPVITSGVACWAIELIKREVNKTLSHFDEGAVGTGATRHYSEVKKCLKHYFQLTKAKKRNYKCPKSMLDANVIPYGYLIAKLRRSSSFANDRRGFKRAIEDTISVMVEAGELEQLPANQVLETFKSKMKVYVLP